MMTVVVKRRHLQLTYLLINHSILVILEHQIGNSNWLFKNCLLQLVVMSKTSGGSLIVPDYIFFKSQDDFLKILNFCRNQRANKALKLCDELIELPLHCGIKNKMYQDQECLPLLDRFLSNLFPDPPAKWLPYFIYHTKDSAFMVSY